MTYRKSNNSYLPERDAKEKEISKIWDSITQHNYQEYVKQQQIDNLNKQKEKFKIKSFLEKQMQEQEFKKQILQKEKNKDRQDILNRVKQFETHKKQLSQTKRQKHQKAKEENLSLIKLKQEKLEKQASESRIEELELLEQISRQQHNSRTNLYLKESEKESLLYNGIKDLSQSALKRNTHKYLNKVEGTQSMIQEYDLLMKNQERYTQKIKRLVQRNENIFTCAQKSSFKNHAVTQKERENRLEKKANKSFIEGIKLRNLRLDEINMKRKNDRIRLQNEHLNQIQDRSEKNSKNKSLELINDKQMVSQLEAQEKKILNQEAEEKVKRRQLCKMNLDSQKLQNQNMNPQVENLKEFGLNKSLIKNF